MVIPSDSVSFMAAGIVESADTGEPIVGAQVFLDGTLVGTVTDHDGRFRLDATGPGDGRIRVRIIGYAEECLEVALRERVMLSFRIALARPPTRPPGEQEEGEASERSCLEPEVVPYPRPAGPGRSRR
ncbi:MAG: carboxypeptidase-like regulatory domain-containing protein [Gemmatimonadota bacterium]|nr:carboxypeptidase-like regulatory domain-containing protein [Gemmatimonadota bacterium]